MNNPYPSGQCTWWCANQCPWCLRYGNLDNAKDWAANWRKHGGFVGMKPAVGTIACFQPGDNRADAVFGHVAVVVQVAATGHFLVSEMNGPAGPGHTDDRWCTADSGVSFLYPANPQPAPLEDDVTLFELEPKGDPGGHDIQAIPGIRAGMTIHLASQDRAGKTGQVLLVFCADGGQPEQSHELTLAGTVPGTHGPVTGNISSATLAGINEGSVTFENLADFRVKVTLTVP